MVQRIQEQAEIQHGTRRWREHVHPKCLDGPKEPVLSRMPKAPPLQDSFDIAVRITPGSLPARRHHAWTPKEPHPLELREQRSPLPRRDTPR